MPRWMGLVAALSLVVSGCSSTSRSNQPLDADARAIEEVAAPETLAPIDIKAAASERAVDAYAPAQTVATAPTVAEEAFVATAASSESEPTAPSQEVEFGPGVSPGVIRIGAALRPKTDHWNTVLYPETFRPDFKKVWSVVTDAINSTGGILGRQLKVVFAPKEDASAELICTFFTEEEPVVAVAPWNPKPAPCLDKAGIATLVHTYAATPTFYRRAPHAVAPLGITFQRANQLYVDALHQQGFFDGDHTIGLLRWDTPDFKQLADEVIKPALARYGHEIAEEVLITSPKSDNQVSNAQADGWNGVQTFKEAGVDRILTLDGASFILPEFTDYAEAQDYHPLYGLNSLVGGEWDMERKQLKGAMGIGWMPWVDLEPQDAYKHGGEGARRCRNLMEAAGEEEQMDTYNEAVWTASICDAVLLLKAALEAGGPSITADSIVAGTERLGASFHSANTLVTRFGPGRHEGVGAIRFLRWFTGCGCFRYTSGLLDAG